MNLSKAIDCYVQRKRLTGLFFHHGELILRTFSRIIGDANLEDVTADHIQNFFDRCQSNAASTFRSKHARVRGFFEYWSRRGAIPFLVMPPNRYAEPKSFVPHIYSKTQVRSLLACARIGQLNSGCIIEAATLRMFILVLYATGATYSEALSLRREDVDIRRSRITMRNGGNEPSRCIPIGTDLKRELQGYLQAGTHNAKRSDLIFRTKFGEPIVRQTLALALQRLMRAAKVGREGNATPKPCFRDFRATFAVHRITAWIKKGADLNRLLPAVATYMGNLSLQSADQYLFLAPERFRKELQKLSPERGRKQWRNDTELMEFLGSL